MTPFQTLTARLVRSVPLSEQTKHLEFEMLRMPRFGFVAGQWLSLKANKPDGEEITRAYSIASPPPQPTRGRSSNCNTNWKPTRRRRNATSMCSV